MSAAGDSNPAVDDAAAARLKQQQDDFQKAKDRGWNNHVPHQFDEAGQPVEQDAEPDAEPAWLSDAAVYAWDDDYGEIGPRNEQLELELFGDPNRQSEGAKIKALQFEVHVSVGGDEDKLPPIRTFEEAGLHPAMLENVKMCKYKTPTAIQAYCLPAVLTGHDVIGIAQTGSGKTAAFLVPILSKLMGKASQLAGPRAGRSTDRVCAQPLVLVVCPTRELACQIFDEARRLCYRTMLRPCVAYGGAPSRNQREQLEKGCDILVATPGRLMDFLENANLLSLARLKFTIIDEADELLSGGWEDIMDKLFSGSGTNSDGDHTYLMFSATFPKSARRLVRDFMEEEHVRIKVGRIGSTHKNITQSIVWVEEDMKSQALYDLILDGEAQRTLVFCNSKFTVDRVDDFLYNKGLPTTSLHSDRTQREREDALRAFRQGKTPIMVATGVSARGLDVANIKHVINYDLPSTSHDGITEYVHRIGRTARIGNEGKATSFYNDRNDDIGEDLVKNLIENEQQIPDFLQDKVPADQSDLFANENNTDAESEVGFDAGADGGFTVDGDTNGFTADEGFKADDGGFTPDEGFKADEGFSADNDDKMGSW